MSRSTRRLPVSLVRSRLLALPLVLLCALAYTSSALHHTLVQHATCLEHGEVVHVEDAGEHAVAPVEDSFDDARVASRRDAAAESHGAEAHCVHASSRRETPPPARGTTLQTVMPTRSSPALAVFRFHSEPVARLHLAPEASPPRA